MAIEVRRSDPAGAYELSLDATVVGRAFFEQQGRPAQLVFTHTVVDDAVAGQHLGSQLRTRSR